MPPSRRATSVTPPPRRRGRRVALALAVLAAACHRAPPTTVDRPLLAIAGAERLPAAFNESYVFLRATIRGRPALLLFDSGASSSLLSTRLVRELGLAERGRRVTFGLGATAVQASAYEGITVTLGRAEIAVPTVLTWNDIDLPMLGKERADGIIGADLLQARVVEIDWQDEVVLAWDSSTVVPQRTGDEVLRLDVVQSLPVVSMRVHTRDVADSLALVVDYGSSGSMILDGSTEIARRLSPALRDLRTRRVIGVGGSVDGPEGRLDSLTAGRHVLRSPLAFLDTAGVRAVSLARADGLLGTELLRRFRLVLDYAGGRAILRPTRRLQAPFCRNVSGICFERTLGTSTVRITYLEPRTPAARAGLALGDELLTLDGVPVTEMSDRELDLRLDIAGTMHSAEVRRGTTTTRAAAPTPPSARGRAAPPRPPITMTVRWRV